MASKSIRRRLHYGEVDRDRDEFVDKSESDGLREPLLGKYAHEHSEAYGPGDQQDEFGEIEGEQLHWTHSFSRWIVQFAQWLAHLVIGPGSLLRRLFLPPSIIQNKQDNETIQESLSSLQEERLRNLRQRLEVSFDSTCVDHQDSLKQLWMLAYPDRELPPLKSELWKEMGWQGTDPSTDFRGGGLISLENLIFSPRITQLLHKQDGKRADWEYPFAVAGVNISFMLGQMLDLQSSNGKPTSKARARFLEMLRSDEAAFDNLYCVAFQLFDVQWLAKRASYMEFNEVLKSTRAQLEQELVLDSISSVQGLPSYKMLCR
ncbi:hypothetical protein J5N97_001318 [Dioscorea zingiberensis]|uniref:ELMO domain-containing protein n=1 Tax=Dioscorea zingiberensis TaxID=325984 RepID=A0A9D5BU71_9LILI|nr:hypothetical protein J5N97_001318 [Dioscorea zingiberensis]